MTQHKDMERALSFLEFHGPEFHRLDMASTGPLKADRKLAAAKIASLIAQVRNETLEGVYRTMEHRSRWASKNHTEPGYVAACKDTLKALDTFRNKAAGNLKQEDKE